MKKLSCLIFLLLMPSAYGMQKKNKSHKKFNIHNAQKKNKKHKTVTVKKQQTLEELYQLNRAAAIKEREIGLARDNRILASIVVGSAILIPTIVGLEHGMRSISCASLLNWCIDHAYK